MWSVLAALACGLFAAAGATLAAWQTSPRQVDKVEATAVLAIALPDQSMTVDWATPSLFGFYTEPVTLGHLDNMVLGDGGELTYGGVHAHVHGRTDLTGVGARLRDAGWRVGRQTTALDSTTRMSAVRGHTVLEFELFRGPTPAGGRSDSATLDASVRRAAPPAVVPAGLAGLLLGAVAGWLIFGWASRRADRHGRAIYALANLAYAATLVLWCLPIAVSAPASLAHHRAEDHAEWHPLWEWLGQPTFALFLLAGTATALAGLGLAALPHTQVRRAGSYPGTTTAPVRRP